MCKHPPLEHAGRPGRGGYRAAGPLAARGGSVAIGEEQAVGFSRGSTVPHRRSDIQGLRAIAVLMVVAFHAGLPVPGGFVGVDVFFVISGFVITVMLHREWATTGRVRFGRFYLRRFKRLTPALAIMVAVTMLISAVVLSPIGPQQNVAKTGVGAMLLAANFAIARTTGGYFDAPAETNPLLNTWSLSVEEQFYLVFPGLITLGWYLARRRGWLRFNPYLIVGAIAVISFALAMATAGGLTFHGSSTILGFYSPVTRAWEFAVGALLALALARWSRHAPRLMAALGATGLIMLAASLWLITDTTPFPGPWTLLPVIGTLLLLLAGTHNANATPRLLSTKPMVKIGDWSYSIYLWHWPFIVFAGLLWPNTPGVLLMAAVASMVPAVTSYRWVERPIRGLSGLTRSRWVALIAVTLLVPIGLAAALGLGASHAWWSEQVKELQSAAIPEHLGAEIGCNTRTPLGAVPAACVQNPSLSGQPVYLLGDSNADHFSEGLIEAAKQLGRPVHLATTSACPFMDVAFSDLRGTYDNDACRAYVRGSLDYLRDAEPGLVMISNTDEYWDSIDYAVGASREQTTTDEAKKFYAIKEGLGNTVKELQDAGHKVLLVQSVPHWDESAPWEPSRCTTPVVLTGDCQATRSLVQARQSRGAIRSAVTAVAAATGATIWDPSDALCPAGLCSTQGPGYVRYRDTGHISVAQAIALTPILREVLVEAE